MRVLAVLVAVLSASGVTFAWGQTESGRGTNSDAGAVGQVVLDQPAAPSRPRVVLLKFALMEFDLPRNEAAENLEWAQQLAILRGCELRDLRAEPLPAFVIEIWSVAEAQKMLATIRKGGKGRMLAEPTLATVSGREAQLHSGGEIPVLIPQESGPAKVEYRPLGIRITATPVYEEPQFRVQLRVLFNQLVGRKLSDPPMPIISSRMIDSPVELREGQAVSVASVQASTESSPAKVWMVVMTPSVEPVPELQAPPHSAGNVDLRELHEEVKLLRADVNRFIELLDKRLPQAD